eukprot:12987000-Alexandrium_andersonii.AAC.1
MQADYMHCKHLGCDQYYAASVLAVLVAHIMGGSAAKNMEEVFAAIKEYYQQNNTSSRFQNLTINMIKGNTKKALAATFPKLS